MKVTRVAKPTKLRRPSWFNPRFDQPSEWATFHVPEEHALGWLVGADTLLNKTPLWGELLGRQESLVQSIRKRNWATVSPWEVVAKFQVIGNIQTGIDTFLPPPYRNWPLEVRRVLYFTNFLMHGAVAIEENLHEDFGLPECAHLRPEARAVIPAVPPLWYVLASPIVLATIQYHQERYIGVDAGLLAVMHETPEHALPLLNESPEALLRRIGELSNVQKADFDYRPDEVQGNVTTQAFLTLLDLQGKKSAGEVLARALAGEFEHWPGEVARDLRHLHRKDSERDTLRIRFQDQKDVERGEISDQVIDSKKPNPLEELIGSKDTKDAHQRAHQRAQRLKELHDDPKTPHNIRRLLSLLLQNPVQSTAALAQQLDWSKPKVRHYRTAIRKFVQP